MSNVIDLPDELKTTLNEYAARFSKRIWTKFILNHTQNVALSKNIEEQLRTEFKTYLNTANNKDSPLKNRSGEEQKMIIHHLFAEMRKEFDNPLATGIDKRTGQPYAYDKETISFSSPEQITQHRDDSKVVFEKILGDIENEYIKILEKRHRSVFSKFKKAKEPSKKQNTVPENQAEISLIAPEQHSAIDDDKVLTRKTHAISKRLETVIGNLNHIITEIKEVYLALHDNRSTVKKNRFFTKQSANSHEESANSHEERDSTPKNRR